MKKMWLYHAGFKIIVIISFSCVAMEERAITLSSIIISGNYISGQTSKKKLSVICTNASINKIDSVDGFKERFCPSPIVKNKISRMFHHIYSLDLSANNLTKAHLAILFQLPELRKVNLSSNKIDSITTDDTNAIPKLAFINLNNNGITSVEIDDDFTSNSKVTLLLKENPLSQKTKDNLTRITANNTKLAFRF